MKLLWLVTALAVALSLSGCASNPFKATAAAGPAAPPARHPDPLMGGR